MTQLIRSKSYGFGRTLFLNSPPSSPSLYLTNDDAEEEEDSFISTPLVFPGSEERERDETETQHQQEHHQFPILSILAAALRKSLITCSVEREDICSIDISWPTDVRHVSHVTFDRYNGFLGLPDEFEPDVPRRVPSASATVFGVSAESMQCCYDDRGNSVPVILLMMQNSLYSEGGLRAEGIFRINAENSQEEYIREQLNRGLIPPGIDVHCLAGLIKAWFRELPTGVLDSLTPDQVMCCNTEEDCTQLVRLLPPTEAALLDWAINLMADVVHNEHHNKMNARNIAMVFAPNMTQMADPLTALIHAVQVMNFLKTMIIKNLKEREELPAECRITIERHESDIGESFPNVHKKSEVDQEHGSLCGGYHYQPIKSDIVTLENKVKSGYGNGDVEGFLDKLNLKKGVKKLCSHPMFQLSKPVK